MPNLNRYIITKVSTDNQFFETELYYSVSSIMETIGIDVDEITLSLNRAFQVCETLHISIDRNFKKIFCYDGKSLSTDWKISALGCYLIIINCNPVNEQVAKAQLYFSIAYQANKKKNDKT
jgi:hypothetical protein